MRKVWSVLILTTAMLLSQASAFAWDDTGHMVVAQVAYSRLNEKAKARVDKMLGTIHYCGKTYDFVTVADWMDDIKSDSLHDSMKVWHYIDLPFFDGVPAREIKQPDENVIARLNWCIAQLRKGTGSDKTDAEMLGYLVHLVGDSHQPLHSTTRITQAHPDGDRGGNDFKIAGVPQASNLHFFWDSEGGLFQFQRVERPLDEARRAQLVKYAQDVMTANPAGKNPEFKELNPEKWIAESHELAKSFVYQTKENEKPDEAYTARAQAVAGKRIALAGYRLAELVNELLGK
jgi:S1/P1 Nuclease